MPELSSCISKFYLRAPLDNSQKLFMKTEKKILDFFLDRKVLTDARTPFSKGGCGLGA